MDDETIPTFVYLKHPVTGETCIYPGGFEQKHLDSAIQYEAKPTDIFVCSSAKCGTTWLQNIVWLIIHEGEKLPGVMRDSIPMLEFSGSETTNKIDDSKYPRIVKTHYKYDWVPKHPTAKYLYITRNPKDAMVSFYYHCKGFHFYKCPDLDFDKMFDLYVNGEVVFWGFFDHLTDWYERRHEANILFLLYEDLKVDPRGEILKIAKFLGNKYYESLLKEGGKLLQQIVEKSSFSTMQLASEELIGIGQRPKNLPFIRKGEVGDWKNHMSSQQSKVMEDLIKMKGDPSGWSSLWDKHENVWESK